MLKRTTLLKSNKMHDGRNGRKIVLHAIDIFECVGKRHDLRFCSWCVFHNVPYKCVLCFWIDVWQIYPQIVNNLGKIHVLSCWFRSIEVFQVSYRNEKWSMLILWRLWIFNLIHQKLTECFDEQCTTDHYKAAHRHVLWMEYLLKRN